MHKLVQKNNRRKVTGSKKHMQVTIPLREASLADIFLGDAVAVDVVENGFLGAKEIRIRKVVDLEALELDKVNFVS